MSSPDRAAAMSGPTSALVPDSRFGAVPDADGTRFTVWSGAAERMWVCLYDGAHEAARVELARDGDGLFTAVVPGVGAGARYGLRADGPYDPDAGLWFDPAKLLVDPHALALDAPFAYDPRLAAARDAALDTAPLMPKAIVTDLPPPRAPEPVRFRPGGLIYETQVRAFSLRHPEVPPALRGTVAALAEPAVIHHLQRIGVDAVELMPITAWIDERHLPPLGLSNAWGYNPVAYLAPDPRLCPGGIAELRATVDALHAAGIGVLLDVVFNHTGESDRLGPTLSLRGLDARAYFRHAPEGWLINDTGCGNTLDCTHPATRRLVLDAMRHFVGQAGVDGFRFDLAPILGRTATGFDPEAPLLREMRADPMLGSRLLIAEPWDIGPGGYNVGRFPKPFLEWSDGYRDRVRRFWQGADYSLGDFVTALAGSGDTWSPGESRGVSFIAAHDGFALADIPAYAHKHNHANGEQNRDGHEPNHSWNNGTEGPTDDPGIRAARHADVKALLATLFMSRGAIMLTAGDEFGRSQGGNNNAYCQDNAITWLDWQHRDLGLETWVALLAHLRRKIPELARPALLTGRVSAEGLPDVAWLTPAGAAMQTADWEAPGTPAFAMVLARDTGERFAVLFNRSHAAVDFTLPRRSGHAWDHPTLRLEARAVGFASETALPPEPGA